MYKNHKIGVVIPAYNEAVLIKETLEGIPEYVDTLFVVNDGSTDKTLECIQSRQTTDPRVHIINHETNQGLGQSVIDGYAKSKESDIDITVVMDGDNQMHPADLPRLLDKIIEDDFDYVKGNRLLHGDIDCMPKYRFWGNSILTILTKFATGYYFLIDPQCAYAAIKNSVLTKIPFARMTKRYAYNAEILCMLNIRQFKVANTDVRPVYGRAQSNINLFHYIPQTSWLLIRLFLRRLWQRYVILDFHPLVLFYIFAMSNFFLIIIPFLIRFFVLYAQEGAAPRTTLMILIFTILISYQSVLFAVWMDMDYNKQKTNK